MAMNITSVTKGFEEFYTQNFTKRLSEWGNSEPASFKDTEFYSFLKYFSSYGLKQEFELEEFEIDQKGNPIASEYLKNAAMSLYSFWQKCLMFGGKSKNLTDNQIAASNFILTLQSRIRMDFGLNFAIDTPSDEKCYFTYSDIYHLAGGSRGHLKNKASEIHIKSKPVEKGMAFSEVHALVNHPELESFYINIPKDIDNISMFTHMDAMRLLSTLKGYKPTKFSFLHDEIETIPDVHDYSGYGQKIINLLQKLPRESGENTLANMLGVDSSFIADIKKKESIKLTFPLLIKLDRAFFSLINKDQRYIPFQMITP